MCVRMKQRYASSGVQTIGSPRTLNDVFTTTGQPVSDSNASMSVVVVGVRLRRHRLHARRVVDVRDRRNVRPRHVQLSRCPRAFVCCSSVIGICRSRFTGATSSMYGESQSISN